MRIFFITHRVPFPPDRGDKIATFNILRHLAKSHDVTVFCLADGEEDMANVAGTLQYARAATAVPIHPIRSKLRVLLALLTGKPLSVAVMAEPALRSAIARACAMQPPDAFVIYSSNVAQFAEPYASVLRIMHFSDLDSLKWRRYAERVAPPMKWIYAIEGQRLLRYERHIAHSFTHSLVCTDVELRDFRQSIPGVPVSLLRNGVDLDYFRSSGAAKVPGRLVFTGVMDYLPNVDAVEWFCKEIFPRIHQQVAEATFVICGSRPNAAVQSLAALPQVTVTGRVPDVRPYLDEAEVFVAPLRIARGIQNKVLEAMAMGLPVVTSQNVFAGTGIAEGEGIAAADDPSVFADHVVRLLRDADYRAAMGQAARRVVERDHSWDAQLVLLSEMLERTRRL